MAFLSIQTEQGDPATITKDTITSDDDFMCRCRAKRNSRLAKSDAWVISDRGLSDSKINEWKTYRQQLRDMDFSDPYNLTWPTKPE